MATCETTNDANFQFGVIDVIDQKNMPLNRLQHGMVTTEQGNASYEYIARAIVMAPSGDIDGIVTGPINKSALNLAGHHYAGNTEIFAAKTGSEEYAMMPIEGDPRVSHVSTHVSSREACGRVKGPRVTWVI